MNITYEKCEDYLIPNLIPDPEPEVLGGELRETQTANYFSNFSPVDCAVPSANA